MRVNPKYIEVFGDTIIPVLGYFLWSWDLYFIVLYFILELLFSEGFLHLKAYKINALRKAVNSWVISGISGILALFTAVSLIHVGFSILTPEIDFQKQLMAFITYEDMGIAQGFVLFPLLILSGYQKYKLEFIRLKKYETLTIQKMWRFQLIKYLFILLLTGCCCLIMLTGISNSLVYLVLILLASAVFKIFSPQP
jgi:hypothetical protein